MDKETKLLVRACRRALLIEQAVTQKEERELRKGYVALLRRALKMDKQERMDNGTQSRTV